MDHALERCDRWLVFWSAMALTLACVAIAGALEFHGSSLAGELEADIGRMRLRMASSPPPAAAVSAPVADFASELPVRADLPALLAELQRACDAADVRLQEVQTQSRTATGSLLGSATLNVQLQGRYAGITQVLAEVQDRQRSVLVQRLLLRSINATVSEVSATATLVLWSRPLLPSKAVPSAPGI